MTDTNETNENADNIRLIADNIRLIFDRNEIKIVGDKFIVEIEALVSDKDGKVISDCPITFYEGTNKLKELNTVKGDPQKNGTAHFQYEAPVKAAGKTIAIRVRVDDSKAENFIEIRLPEKISRDKLGEGWDRFFNSMKYRIHEKKNDYWFYIWKSLFIFIPAIVILWFGEKNVSLILSILSGALFWRFFSSKMTSVACWIIWVAFCYKFPMIFTRSLMWGMVYFIFFGLFFYWFEEVSYKPKFTVVENNEIVEWEKRYNFYPVFPIIICNLIILLNILSIASYVFTPFSPLVDKPSFEMGTSVKMVDLYNYSLANSFNLHSLREPIEDLFDIADCLVAIIIIFFYAIPNKLKNIFKKRKEKLNIGTTLTEMLVLKKTIDLFQTIRRR